MRMTRTAANAIAVEEGFLSRPKKCPAGKLTVMFGRNLDDNPFTVEEGEYCLARELEKIEEKMHGLFGLAGWVIMGEARNAALLSIAYQCGWSGFLGFKDMIAAAKAHDWLTAAIACMDSAAAEQCPDRYERNATVLRTGEWHPYWNREAKIEV